VQQAAQARGQHAATTATASTPLEDGRWKIKEEQKTVHGFWSRCPAAAAAKTLKSCATLNWPLDTDVRRIRGNNASIPEFFIRS
jgi:hypothetical protein